MNKYEAMIIFRESLKDTEWDEAVEAVKAEVEKQGGTMSSCTRLGKREFARAMKKQTGGHYALLALQLDGQKVAPLLARLKLDERVFRVQVVNAPANPLPPPKPTEGEGDGVAE